MADEGAGAEKERGSSADGGARSEPVVETFLYTHFNCLLYYVMQCVKLHRFFFAEAQLADPKQKRVINQWSLLRVAPVEWRGHIVLVMGLFSAPLNGDSCNHFRCSCVGKAFLFARRRRTERKSPAVFYRIHGEYFTAVGSGVSRAYCRWASVTWGIVHVREQSMPSVQIHATVFSFFRWERAR